MIDTDTLEPDRTPPRRFWLVRHHDVSDVSEPGIVAEGTVWSSGPPKSLSDSLSRLTPHRRHSW